MEDTAPENQQSTSQSTLTGDPDARKSVLSQHTDCFDGIGCFRKPHHITIDPVVPPVIHPPRRVPVSNSVHELDRARAGKPALRLTAKTPGHQTRDATG